MAGRVVDPAWAAPDRAGNLAEPGPDAEGGTGASAAGDGGAEAGRPRDPGAAAFRPAAVQGSRPGAGDHGGGGESPLRAGAAAAQGVVPQSRGGKRVMSEPTEAASPQEAVLAAFVADLEA